MHNELQSFAYSNSVFQSSWTVYAYRLCISFIKVRPSTFIKSCFICFSESPVKMLFISSCKPFLFLEYMSFCLDFLSYRENVLIKKIRLISKFWTSQPDWKTITIQILLSVSRYWTICGLHAGQYVYCNCFFPRLRHHNFLNQPYLFNWVGFLNDQKAKMNI